MGEFDSIFADLNSKYSTEPEKEGEFSSLFSDLSSKYSSVLEEENIKAKGEAERSFLGDTASHLARGGVSLLESTARGIETVTGSETADKAGDYFRDLHQDVAFLRPDESEVRGDEGIIKRGWNSAGESLPESLAIIPAAMAGAAAGTAVLPGAGTAIGGVIGGGGALLGLFGAGTYGKQKDAVNRELALTRPELTPEQREDIADKNALTHAYAEVGGEGVGDAAAFLIFKAVPGGGALYKGGKQILKELAAPGAIKTIGKGLLKDAPFEVGSEVGTSYFQNEADIEAGTSKTTTADAMQEAIIPALFLTTGMGVTLGGMSAIERQRAYNKINEGTFEEREERVKLLAGNLAQATDKDIARKWYQTAMGYVAADDAIPLDVNVAELAARKPDPPELDAAKDKWKNAETVDDVLDAVETVQAINEPIQEAGQGLMAEATTESTGIAGENEATVGDVLAGKGKKKTRTPREKIKTTPPPNTGDFTDDFAGPSNIPAAGLIEEAKEQVKLSPQETSLTQILKDHGPEVARQMGMAWKNGEVLSIYEAKERATAWGQNEKGKGQQTPPQNETLIAATGPADSESTRLAGETRGAVQPVVESNAVDEVAGTSEKLPAIEKEQIAKQNEQQIPTPISSTPINTAVVEQGENDKTNNTPDASTDQQLTSASAPSGVTSQDAAEGNMRDSAGVNSPADPQPSTSLADDSPVSAGVSVQKEPFEMDDDALRNEMRTLGQVIENKNKAKPFVYDEELVNRYEAIIGEMSSRRDRGGRITEAENGKWFEKKGESETYLGKLGYEKKGEKYFLAGKPYATAVEQKSYQGGYKLETTEFPAETEDKLEKISELSGKSYNSVKRLYQEALNRDGKEKADDILDNTVNDLSPTPPPQDNTANVSGQKDGKAKAFNPVDMLTGKENAPPTQEERSYADIAIDSLDAAIVQEQQKLEEIRSRKYKKNDKTVSVGGDIDSLNSSSATIGSINAKRKTRMINDAEKRIAKMTEARDKIAGKRYDDDRAKDVMNGLSDDGIFVQAAVPAESPQLAAKTEQEKTPTIAESPAYGAGNKLVSVSRADEIRAKLRAKLGNVNSGVDPEIAMLGMELAVFHIEAGARSFAAYSKAVINDLGEAAKPLLKMWYNAARDYPGVPTEGMDDYDAVSKTDVKAIFESKETVITEPKPEAKQVDTKPLNTELEKLDAKIGELYQLRECLNS